MATDNRFIDSYIVVRENKLLHEYLYHYIRDDRKCKRIKWIIIAL